MIPKDKFPYHPALFESQADAEKLLIDLQKGFSGTKSILFERLSATTSPLLNPHHFPEEVIALTIIYACNTLRNIDEDIATPGHNDYPTQQLEQSRTHIMRTLDLLQPRIDTMLAGDLWRIEHHYLPLLDTDTRVLLMRLKEEKQANPAMQDTEIPAQGLDISF